MFIHQNIYEKIFSNIPKTLLYILVPGIGCGFAAWLVRRFAPNASYDGTSALVDAFHNRRSKMSPKTTVTKGFASIITLASGGSGGKEGPVAQVGAGVGSFFADYLKLSVKESVSYF